MSSRSQKSKLAGLISSRVSTVVGVGTVLMGSPPCHRQYRGYPCIVSATVCQGASREDGMRVIGDRRLCESNAVCARLVPEFFVVGDDDRLQITQEAPPAALRERVEHAVRRCPKLALSIVED